MSDLAAELKRVNYELEEENVSVTSLVDHQNLRFDGIRINLSEGQETEVPLWIAEILEEKQLVIINYEQNFKLSDIVKIEKREASDPSLHPVDSLLYRRVMSEIERLSKGNTAAEMRRKTIYEGRFTRILRLRFSKILNISIGSRDNQDDKKLTAEELWLANKLREIKKSWDETVGTSTVGVE